MINETWTENVEGLAGWNKYGFYLLDERAGGGLYNRFSASSNGLELVSPPSEGYLQYVSQVYTWHPLTPDQIDGEYTLNYWLAGLATGNHCTLEYLVAYDRDTKQCLWIRDTFRTNERTVRFMTSRTLEQPTTMCYGPDWMEQGTWAQSSAYLKVKHLGNGTWQCTFGGIKDESAFEKTFVVGPYGAEVYTPSCTRHGLRVGLYGASTTGLRWTASSFSFPYRNNEWQAPSEVAYVGTWYDGDTEMAGYLPLGDRLISCSDIVDYAYEPLEFRGWSSSCTLSLADSDKFMRNNVLGRLAGDYHLFGRFVVKKQIGGVWYTMFTGILNEQPEYDYESNIVNIQLDSVLKGYEDATFDYHKPPFQLGTVGNWDASFADGKHCVRYKSEGSFPGIPPAPIVAAGDVLYPQDHEEDTITVKEVINTISSRGYRYTVFTIEEATVPGSFVFNAIIYARLTWPDEYCIQQVLEDPVLLIQGIMDNAGLILETDPTTTGWLTSVSKNLFEKLPRIRHGDNVIATLNEVCAALNTAHTVSPEGRVRLYSLDCVSANCQEVALSEHYGEDFSISLLQPVNRVEIDYGFDEKDGSGPTRHLSVEVGEYPQHVSDRSISTRFISSNIGAATLAHRAARRITGAVPVLVVELDGREWGRIPAGTCVIIDEVEDYLGDAAPESVPWIVANRTYKWATDTVVFTLISKGAEPEWVTWGDSLAENSGRRWF